MSMSNEDLLLSAIEDPGTAKVLAEILKQIEGEPMAAARMLRAFQSAKAVLNEALQDLPEKWKQLEEQITNADLHRLRFIEDLRDFRKDTTTELAAATEDLKKLQEWVEKLDEDKFLNKLNRLLDLCDRLARAKKDGTFDTLQRLL